MVSVPRLLRFAWLHSDCIQAKQSTPSTVLASDAALLVTARSTPAWLSDVRIGAASPDQRILYFNKMHRSSSPCARGSSDSFGDRPIHFLNSVVLVLSLG